LSAALPSLDKHSAFDASGSEPFTPDVCGESAEATVTFLVLSISGLNLDKDSDMVRVSPQFIKEFAQSEDRDDTDAIFISRGALWTLDVVDAIEDSMGKPVIASNQAMIWKTLGLADINDQIAGHGQLLQNI